ncbi:hypothetical protein ROZALSC1DRAFT_27783 [Rozella allomycis CSF55]|uniref:Ras-associating domain-containing protein n=1 Tax=Rozella allomycis (strain CSF55) TaxID=988480 RepID=A0A4P9YM45_ROZAC|nr:hypothetical protein ROZALSC1DRAFT_27783 [Rozella allomycis CSF55]
MVEIEKYSIETYLAYKFNKTSDYKYDNCLLRFTSDESEIEMECYQLSFNSKFLAKEVNESLDSDEFMIVVPGVFEVHLKCISDAKVYEWKTALTKALYNYYIAEKLEHLNTNDYLQQRDEYINIDNGEYMSYLYYYSENNQLYTFFMELSEGILTLHKEFMQQSIAEYILCREDIIFENKATVLPSMDRITEVMESFALDVICEREDAVPTNDNSNVYDDETVKLSNIIKENQFYEAYTSLDEDFFIPDGRQDRTLVKKSAEGFPNYSTSNVVKLTGNQFPMSQNNGDSIPKARNRSASETKEPNVFVDLTRRRNSFTHNSRSIDPKGKGLFKLKRISTAHNLNPCPESPVTIREIKIYADKIRPSEPMKTLRITDEHITSEVVKLILKKYRIPVEEYTRYALCIAKDGTLHPINIL